MPNEPLLDREFLERLERLAIHWQRSFAGLVGGHNRSRFAGGGQEFLDHRHFHQGDDLRAVNWRAYMRLDKMFLKMFQIEPRVPVRMLLDTSASEGSVKHNRDMGQERTGLEIESLPYALQAERPEATESAATMANDLLLQTESDSEAAVAHMGGIDLDLTFGVPVEEKPIWSDLYENIRDVFFPPKLPPLELTSTPIPVPDRMAVKRNPLAVGISTTLNGLFLAFLLLVGVKTIVDQKKQPVILTPIDLTEFKAPKATVAAGGGGGSPDKVVVEKGKTPPRIETPVAPKLEPPLPSIDVQKDIIIPDNPVLPNFGMSNSPNVKLDSLGNGRGSGARLREWIPGAVRSRKPARKTQNCLHSPPGKRRRFRGP